MVLPPQIGFLYLRYAANPRNIWEWIQPYVRDSEVRPGAHALMRLTLVLDFQRSSHEACLCRRSTPALRAQARR